MYDYFFLEIFQVSMKEYLEVFIRIMGSLNLSIHLFFCMKHKINPRDSSRIEIEPAFVVD